MKLATLELIAQANGKPTGDDIRAARKLKEAEDLKAELAALPYYMNSRQRKALRRTLAKAQEQEEL